MLLIRMYSQWTQCQEGLPFVSFGDLVKLMSCRVLDERMKDCSTPTTNFFFFLVSNGMNLHISRLIP